MCPHIKESELSVVMIIAGHISYLADHNYLIKLLLPAASSISAGSTFSPTNEMVKVNKKVT